MGLSTMSAFFNLFKYMCTVLDNFLFEPLFYFIMATILFGVYNIEKAREGLLFTSRKSLFIRGFQMIIIGIVLLWYYWFKTNIYSSPYLPRL